jgi:hypothetical protein
MPRPTSTGPSARKPSRRDSLRLLAAALVAPALLPGEVRAQDAGVSSASAATAPPAAPALESVQAAAAPWPTTEKLQKTNEENVAALKKVALANGDVPDLLPHPSTRARGGAR